MRIDQCVVSPSEAMIARSLIQSGPQCPDRDDVDAVVANVSIARPDDHAEHGWAAALARVDLPNELVEARRALVQESRSKLNLESCPTAVCRLDDRIDLEAVAVAVLENMAVDCLRVDTQIAHDERLEQEAEQVQVLQEALGRGTQSGDRKRRVHE